MLKIALLTKNPIIHHTVSLLLKENGVTFEIVHEYQTDVNLVIGGVQELLSIPRRVMMFAIITEYQHNNQLSKNGLFDFILEEDVERDFYTKFSHWLDYYFENYHYTVNETQDFFLDDVLYFNFKGLKEVEVVLRNKPIITYPVESTEVYSHVLPLNFIASGKQHMINIDYIKEIKENEVIMMDGQVFHEVQIHHVKEREIRYELTDSSVISIGDYPSLEKIKKTKKLALFISLFVVVAFTFWMTKANLPIFISLPIGLILAFLMNRLSLISALNLTGNYYQLKNNGIYYFDCISFKDKLKWINAIEKGITEKFMQLLPFEDIAYLRLKSRVAVSMVSGHFMYLNVKNYHLNMIIETKTSSLNFNNVHLNELIKGQILSKNTMSSFINLARLKGIDIQENENFLYPINDPNATLSQYLNKMNIII